MARAIVEKRPSRCSGDLALHVLGVMSAILRSADEMRALSDIPRCERPQAFSAQDARALLAS